MEKKFSDLIVFDLDGTLVHSNEQGQRGVPEALLKVVHELSNQAHVIVATGRRWRGAQKVLEVLPLLPYVVVNNGLVIRDGRGASCKRVALDLDQARQVTQVFQSNGFSPIYVFDGGEERPDFLFSQEAFQLHGGYQKLEQHARPWSKIDGNPESYLRDWSDYLVEVAAVDYYPVLLNLRSKIENLIPANLRSVVVRNCGYEDYSVLEVLDRNSSKWSAVEWVANHLDVRRVVTVGDDENDMEMLSGADLSIVMSHALEHVKACGDLEVEGHEGLTQFLVENWLS